MTHLAAIAIGEKNKLKMVDCESFPQTPNFGHSCLANMLRSRLQPSWSFHCKRQDFSCVYTVSKLDVCNLLKETFRNFN